MIIIDPSSVVHWEILQYCPLCYWNGVHPLSLRKHTEDVAMGISFFVKNIMMLFRCGHVFQKCSFPLFFPAIEEWKEMFSLGNAWSCALSWLDWLHPAHCVSRRKAEIKGVFLMVFFLGGAYLNRTEVTKVNNTPCMLYRNTALTNTKHVWVFGLLSSQINLWDLTGN